ncbi:MAG TPA: DUF447 family protein [Synergistales bacterium]|jgi:hypothetical protein|nr:DUF447 family protein [Synergistota bacterium]HOI81477.1 DUF447 family protein [Synergistales bacterium]
MIIETIFSTRSADGENNFAPMGMERTDAATVLVRPFRSSLTWENLNRNGFAVAGITDSILPFVYAATKDRKLGSFPAFRVPCHVPADPCSWVELELKRISLEGERGECIFRIVHEEYRRPFSGFNRARYAILEALVAATRVDIRGREPFLAEYARAVELTRRTGGEEERLALLLIEKWTGGIA